ncbi:hypothetical protein I6E50_03090 [Roseburia hominis]|uniref:hypothetical protein n=1 Tax=Roseburia hominis TaxID=301301 RepID=UPI001F279766|nr:hypothetical protein [Roseburia hominis]
MDLTFLTMLPQFQQLSEEKQKFLLEFAAKKPEGGSKDAAKNLMDTVAQAKKRNISFTPEESTLLIQVLKQGMSKEEAEKTDRMIQMVQQFKMMQQFKK